MLTFLLFVKMQMQILCKKTAPQRGSSFIFDVLLPFHLKVDFAFWQNRYLRGQ